MTLECFCGKLSGGYFAVKTQVDDENRVNNICLKIYQRKNNNKKAAIESTESIELPI